MINEPFSFSFIPKTFRKETLGRISKVIKSGGSLQLVGLSGIGSSMIAKALTQIPDIRSLYFTTNYAFIFLDGNSLLERNSINLSRLLLSSLTLDAEVTKDEVVIQKEIEEKLVEFCLKGNLVIVVDHAEELNYPELKPFFTNLYSVFRKLEPKLHLLFVVPKPLLKSEDVNNFGHVGKVITQNIIHVGLLNKADSLWIIEEEEKKLGIKLTEKETEKVYEISGGFPRTIKKLLESVKNDNDLGRIENNPTIYLPLSLHLDELSRHNEIINKIPILQKYIESKDSKRSGEHIDGIHFENKLTRNEEKLLKLFILRKGEIIEREKGIEHLWGEGSVEVSDHAYDQIVLRLRKKLQSSSPKAGIETVRGRGHILKVQV